MDESVTEVEVVREWAAPFYSQGGPRGFPGKPILRLLSDADTLFQSYTAGVVGLVQGVLVALGVVEFDVEVAVLTLIGKLGPGTDGHDIAVER